MNDTIIIAIIGSITSIILAIPGIVAFITQRKRISADVKKAESESDKTRADTSAIIQKMALELIDPYRERVVELESRVSHLEMSLEETFDCLLMVVDCATKLYAQISHLNVTPACSPPDKETIMQKKKNLLNGRKPKQQPTPANGEIEKKKS